MMAGIAAQSAPRAMQSGNRHQSRWSPSARVTAVASGTVMMNSRKPTSDDDPNKSNEAGQTSAARPPQGGGGDIERATVLTNT